MSHDPVVRHLAVELRWLLHNVVCHPIAGVLWFVGAERAGDWVHRWP